MSLSPVPVPLTRADADAIPETLLALAKDERYVRQCQHLLNQILPGDSCLAGLSWLLYSLLVVRRTNKTLGMEFCGLSVADDADDASSSPSTGNDSGNNRLWKLMALSATLSMAIEWYFRKAANDVQDTAAADALRGRARHLFHQRQRQAMLQRGTTYTAQEPEAAVSASTSDAEHSSGATAASRSFQLRTLLQKLKEILKSTLLDLSVSTVAQEGPHRIITTGQGAESLSKWIVRLIMVRFLIKGNFFSWNLFGIRLTKDHNNLLSNRPSLHRFIALLYLQQAATSGFLRVVHVMTQLWVQYRRGNLSATQEMADAAEQLYSTSDMMSCGICKLPRVHPAISSHCGHVFCWRCLYQWTSTVRQECPLCRAACRPQEILALYRYRPT